MNKNDSDFFHKQRIKNIIKIRVENNIIFLDKKINNSKSIHSWKCICCNSVFKNSLLNLLNLLNSNNYSNKN